MYQGKCFRDYTTVYSQPSKVALENLISCIIETFGIVGCIEDMFYYGVFMKPQNYAHYKFDTDEDYGFEIPFNLTAECAKENEKIDFVQQIIKQIMQGKITKPQWMIHVEMNMICNKYGQAPSTFLYIEPKSAEYAKLAQRLTEFLYSVNMNITMLKD